MSGEQKPFVPKTPLDFQKMKLERLMANPEKPVIIPEGPREKRGLSVPEFVRNVMGSSAGAGSGEFHVYRHLRRKEYTRQKLIEERSEKEKLDDEYLNKIEENKRKMEESTAKKRAKRLKRKAKLKQRKNNKGSDLKKSEMDKKDTSDKESSETHSDEDEEVKNSLNCSSDLENNSEKEAEGQCIEEKKEMLTENKSSEDKKVTETSVLVSTTD